MVKNYLVPRLADNTPEGDRKKLSSALSAVAGVERVTLKPESHQFEIHGKKGQEPNWSDISSASMKAGFEIKKTPTK